MHVRLLIIHTETKRIDEAAMLFEESVIPLCKDKKGYVGASFLADRKTGKCILITRWDSEDHMLATEQSRFFQEQVVKFMGFFKSDPIRESYEVVIQD